MLEEIGEKPGASTDSEGVVCNEFWRKSSSSRFVENQGGGAHPVCSIIIYSGISI